MKLISDSLLWYKPPDYKKGDKLVYDWEHLVVALYFPIKGLAFEVRIAPCIGGFTKPQQMNILSWVRFSAERDNYDDLKIPRGYKSAQILIGHTPDGRGEPTDPDSILEVRTSGWIYPNIQDQFELSEEAIANCLLFRET